jgi:ATP-dependent DNA helicase DinG
VRLQEHLEALADQLEIASVRSKGLETCFKRAEELEEQFNNILHDKSGKWVRWYETHRKSLALPNCLNSSNKIAFGLSP